MRNYEGVLFEPTIDYQTGLAGPEKRENWRSRHPYLILDTRTHVVRPPSGVRGAASRIGELWEQDAIDDTDTPTLAIKQALAAGIAQTFLDKGNRVIGWPLDENQGHNHPEALDYFTGISFIDLGKTTDA
ncbi:MAG TPA: hypothetical protein VFB03_02460, partial [Candidatus Saccharimonadales bacterium]|nr:hypothetical protein [Candidatus Saccharimonadales bacterium]